MRGHRECRIMTLLTLPTSCLDSARSGFSFLPTAEGIVLHGALSIDIMIVISINVFFRRLLQRIRQRQTTRRRHARGHLVSPVLPIPSHSILSLTHTLIHITRFSIAQPDATSTSKKAQSERLVAKWERRKRHGKAYAPSLRSGCTMALWAARDMGVLFGGVSDEDPDEENLTSVFFNDLCASLRFLLRMLQTEDSFKERLPMG